MKPHVGSHQLLLLHVQGLLMLQSYKSVTLSNAGTFLLIQSRERQKINSNADLVCHNGIRELTQMLVAYLQIILMEQDASM